MTAFGQTAFGQNCVCHVWSSVFLHMVGCVPPFCGCCVWLFWCVQHFLGVFNIFAAPPPPPTPSRTSLPGPPSAGQSKIAFFFPSPATFLFFVCLGVFSLNFGSARLSSQAGGFWPPALHTTAHELQTCTFKTPALQTHPKFHEKTSKRGKKERKNVAGKRIKREILGLPPLPHPLGAPPFGDPPFGNPPFGAHPPGPTHSPPTHNLAKCCLAKIC